MAREALELHHSLPSPITAGVVDSAMALYAKTFGTALAFAFTHKVLRELWNKVQ